MMDYTNREAVKKHFENNGTTGWFVLLDIVYDHKPEQVTITEVFEKYAGLEVRYSGEDEDYSYLLNAVRTISEHLCQVCGASGKQALIDGWETTLCDEHFECSDARTKIRT